MHRTARTHAEREAALAVAPDQPTAEWPGGWIIVDAEGRRSTPHNAMAWRSRGDAERYAAGREVRWTPTGYSWGSLPIPLDAEYWSRWEMAQYTADPVGATEIASRAGVKRDTVEEWRRRHPDFPPRRWTVGGRPAWDWPDVAAWLQRTGRMTEATEGSTR